MVAQVNQSHLFKTTNIRGSSIYQKSSADVISDKKMCITSSLEGNRLAGVCWNYIFGNKVNSLTQLWRGVSSHQPILQLPVTLLFCGNSLTTGWAEYNNVTSTLCVIRPDASQLMQHRDGDLPFSKCVWKQSSCRHSGNIKHNNKQEIEQRTWEQTRMI